MSSTHYNHTHIHWLQLIRTPGIGSVTMQHLLSLYSDVGEALNQLPAMAKRAGGSAIRPFSYADAEKELHQLTDYGATLLLLTDQHYPALLKQITNPPPVLTVLGNPTLLNQPSLAIVGTRHPSLNAYAFTQTLSSELATQLTIVSGLALGIDTAAHKGALAYPNGTTLAVTACGIDQIYPRQNTTLYHELIAENRGVILTEMPFGTKPQPYLFPKRNRIISGVSIGTVVVEATLHSGSLITAQTALEQNRDVFAVPGFPLDPRCKGSNDLLKQGAILVRNSQDIFDALADTTLLSPDMADNAPAAIAVPAPITHQAEYTEIQRTLLAALHTTACNIDLLAEKLHIPIPLLLTVILELELAGKIQRHPGNAVSLIIC